MEKPREKSAQAPRRMVRSGLLTKVGGLAAHAVVPARPYNSYFSLKYQPVKASDADVRRGLVTGETVDVVLLDGGGGEPCTALFLEARHSVLPGDNSILLEVLLLGEEAGGGDEAGERDFLLADATTLVATGHVFAAEPRLTEEKKRALKEALRAWAIGTRPELLLYMEAGQPFDLVLQRAERKQFLCDVAGFLAPRHGMSQVAFLAAGVRDAKRRKKGKEKNRARRKGAGAGRVVVEKVAAPTEAAGEADGADEEDDTEEDTVELEEESASGQKREREELQCAHRGEPKRVKKESTATFGGGVLEALRRENETLRIELGAVRAQLENEQALHSAQRETAYFKGLLAGKGWEEK